MQQPSGRVFPFQLSYLCTRKDGRHQMQAALIQKSAQHCEAAGKTEPGLRVGSLITHSINAIATSDTGGHKQNGIEVNTKVRELSAGRTLAVWRVHCWEQLKALRESTMYTPFSVPGSSLRI